MSYFKTGASCQEEKCRSSSNIENSGHVALLIADIIMLSYPIMLGEIELALEAMGINTNQRTLSRHIYLLTKLNIINVYHYSGYKYYYPINPKNSFFNFIKSRMFEVTTIHIKLKAPLIDSEVPSDRKRRCALKEINKLISGGIK